MSTVKGKAISGTIWTTMSSVVQIVVQMLRLSILTRFLEKSDFGLVAIVVLILGFTHIFTDLGVSISLFSRKDITRKSYSSLYWVSILLSVVLYLLLLFLSPFITDFYNFPKLQDLIPIMGLDLIITTAGRQFKIVKQKKLQFKSIALIDILGSTFSLILALVLAIKGWGIYSLVWSTLSASFFVSFFLITTSLKSHPLVFYINLKEGKSFYRIGLYQTGAQILDYIASQIDILIIGKLMPPSDLGVYNLVKQLVLRVYNLINPIVTSVSVPILAKLKDNITLLRKYYLESIKVVAIANFAIYALIALLSKEFLLVLYGKTYKDSYFILQLLCVWGALASIGSAASNVVVITGRTDLGFRWTVMRLLCNPMFVIAGSVYGFEGLVYGQILFMFLFFSVYWKVVVNRTVDSITYFSYAKNVIPLFFGTVIIVIVLLSLKNLIFDDFLSVWLTSSLIALIFLFLYLLINKRILRELFQTLKNKTIQ